MKIGSTTVPLLLDTGSSDLWVISDSCPKNCSAGLPTYPHKKLNYSGVDARLFYGDSFSRSTRSKSTVSFLTYVHQMANMHLGPLEVLWYSWPI